MKAECIKFLKWVFAKRKLKLDFDVDDMWEDYYLDNKQKNYGCLYINWVVAQHFEVDPIWMKSKGKEHTRTLPRQIAQYMMGCFGHSNDTIRKFYNQDHSNITHSLKTIRNEIATNKLVESTVNEIKNKFG